MKTKKLAKASLFAGTAALLLALLGLGSARMDPGDPGRTPSTRSFPTGNVIFFHPDGSGLNHWGRPGSTSRDPTASSTGTGSATWPSTGAT
ncbi:hypothetical protein [Thermus sp.]